MVYETWMYKVVLLLYKVVLLLHTLIDLINQ